MIDDPDDLHRPLNDVESITAQMRRHGFDAAVRSVEGSEPQLFRAIARRIDGIKTRPWSPLTYEAEGISPEEAAKALGRRLRFVLYQQPTIEPDEGLETSLHVLGKGHDLDIAVRPNPEALREARRELCGDEMDLPDASEYDGPEHER